MVPSTCWEVLRGTDDIRVLVSDISEERALPETVFRTVFLVTEEASLGSYVPRVHQDVVGVLGAIEEAPEQALAFFWEAL